MCLRCPLAQTKAFVVIVVLNTARNMSKVMTSKYTEEKTWYMVVGMIKCVYWSVNKSRLGIWYYNVEVIFS